MRGDGTGVAIVGVGITKHGFFPGRDWKDLVVESSYAAIEDAGVDPGAIDAGFVSVTLPETFEQQNLGPIAADELGLSPTGFTQVVAACAGGGHALDAGVSMIASGRATLVLAVGVEKQSDAMATPDSMLHYLDAELEAPAGFDYVDSMALMHDRYREKYRVGDAAIAQWAVQDRWYAQRNPVAIDHGRRDLSIDEVLSSPAVSAPITRAACGRACDGSSAVLLAPTDALPSTAKHPVLLAGSAHASGPNALASKFGYARPSGASAGSPNDLAEAVPTSEAARRAYHTARISPADIDVVQVHDCFTIMGPLHLEGLGIFPKGKAALAVADGATALGGRCPANTDGGRIGLGHPTGTTGLNVAVESVFQLRGAAGERQVDDAQVAVCQSMGGNNTTSAVAVLRRMDSAGAA